MIKKRSHKDWIPVPIKISPEIGKRIEKILDRKPHYSRSAILIDAIEEGLSTVEAREKVG